MPCAGAARRACGTPARRPGGRRRRACVRPNPPGAPSLSWRSDEVVPRLFRHSAELETKNRRKKRRADRQKKSGDPASGIGGKIPEATAALQLLCITELRLQGFLRHKI